MPKIRCLKIQFAQSIPFSNIPKFRAAIIEKTERQASLFHNHKNNDKVIYRYPLIQYKITDDKASIVCLNNGTEDIHYLLKHRNLSLQIGKAALKFEIDAMNMHYFEVATSEVSHHYQLINWLALNQRSYKEYRALERDELAQKQLLEKILIGNILAFAKGIDWHVDEKIKVQFLKPPISQMLEYKKEKMLGFSAQFSCNVALPNFIGLGKGSSIGFGVIKSISKHSS